MKSKKNLKLKTKKSKTSSDDAFSGLIHKKPSKAELKTVIAALKKDNIQLIVVRKALKYVPHFLKSQGLTKKLLKEIIRLWAEASEKIRVVCLLCLVRIFNKLRDKELKQSIIKKLYTTFLTKSRITKLETMSMIGFMRHSLVELYKLDSDIAFKQAQSSCQQLTVTLKNALTHKNEETYKTVLNWQFCNCLILLSNLIISHDDKSPLKSLTQQVIQLNLDALDLMFSPRYYPYYFHIIDNLINLSSHSGLFIPILPLIMTILDKIDVPHKRRVAKRKKSESEGDEDEDEDENEDAEDKESHEKEYNMELLNHVKIEEAHSLNYKVAALDKLHELLAKYLAGQCHRIAFPELVLLPSVQLKKWIKKNQGDFTIKFKVLLDKIKADCETSEKERKSIDFAFTNYAAVDAWERRLRDSKRMSLPKLIEQ